MELRRPKALALVLAGGAGGRLDVLTAERPKPALPFGGVYRLIDFPLSNCRHSGISDVWVLQQYQPHSLTEHLANGRPWDLDRTHGGLRVLHPYLGRSESGWYEGNADAIFRNKADIRSFGADVLLVLSADHVYKLNYSDLIARHSESDAEVTIVTTDVPREQASRFGVVKVARSGRIEEFQYKPDEPASTRVTTEVFVYTVEALLDALDDLADDDEDSGLADFGDELLPRLVDQGCAYEYRLDGYWRDVGTIDSYWKAHMDLLEPRPGISLDDPEWPILTSMSQRAPALVRGPGHVDGCLISPGCRVSGNVEHSVLGPGARVEENAIVRDAVLLEGATILAGATVERAIVDAGAVIREEARVGGPGGELTVVGMHARVGKSAAVLPGEQIEPSGTRAPPERCASAP